AAALRVLRRALALGEARGYEPETSEARFRFACFGWYFVPIEDVVQAARRAGEGLIAGGDLAYAGYSHYVTVAGLLDCAPSQDGASDRDEREALLSELDEVMGWLAARAVDAPENFLHLLRLVEAERAWAVGDFRAAALGFDAARREAAGRRRPWHRALITERA